MGLVGNVCAEHVAAKNAAARTANSPLPLRGRVRVAVGCGSKLNKLDDLPVALREIHELDVRPHRVDALDAAGGVLAHAFSGILPRHVEIGALGREREEVM